MTDLQREPLEKDERAQLWNNWPGAVLLSDEINHYCQGDPALISPFDEKNLKPARYQLTLGGEARVGGKTVLIDDEHPLVIRPHQVAIVRTHETLNIPRFLIGRWNLRVDMVYRGLLWVGALQVDPGWVGYLPCPLYNLSDETVVIRYRETYVSIDFVRTSRFEKGCLRYPTPAFNPPVSLYDPNSLRSGPYEMLQNLDNFRGQAKEAVRRVGTLTNYAFVALGIIFTVLAVIVAVVAIITTRPPVDVFVSFFGTLAFIFSAVALILSGLAVSLFWRSPH